MAQEIKAADKPVAPATTKSKGERVFFTGHSFFIAAGYMAKKVDLIAKAAGKEKHELVGWRYSGGGSGAVDKWWAKGADEEPRKNRSRLRPRSRRARGSSLPGTAFSSLEAIWRRRLT